MKYYKVVFNDGITLASARYVGFSMPVHTVVKYKIGEFVKPVVRGTKLFVFDSLQAAKNFQMRSEEIYECEIGRVCEYFYISTVSDLADFMKAKLYHRKTPQVNTLEPIPGTVFTNKVKLLRKVS